MKPAVATITNIILVGPMGAGKSRIGPELARRCSRRLVDADAEIERDAGTSIADIFHSEGEDGFRRREREKLATLLQDDGLVLATGGGAVLDAGTRALLVERGFVVHLHASPATQLARIAGDAGRPLLQQDDPAAVLHALAIERAPLYAAVADLRIDTDGLDPADVVAEILSNLPVNTIRNVAVGGAHPYDISIGAGLFDDGARLTEMLRGRHALLVSDANVAPLYADRVQAAMQAARPGIAIARMVIPAGEHEKTLARFTEVLEALAASGATRDAAVVALGGGVVGDLAGFAAACWMRGIDVIQLPTTLLAMVDSSVGGKTAVDLPAGKNLAGAFHPPRAVIADTSTLDTLPDRELRAGLAEVVKYGAIARSLDAGDATFLDWLEDHADALLARDHAVLAEAIARCCAFKAAVVGRDPLEHGDRALLNFGHTFGHAIEAEQGYAGTLGGGLNHGEAVAVGMVLAMRLSVALALAPASSGDRLQRLLQRLGLPTALPDGLDPRALLARMRLDKKADAGGIRFILCDGAGRARIVPGVDEADVLAAMTG